MKYSIFKTALIIILALVSFSKTSLTEIPRNLKSVKRAPVNTVFMQANNLNAALRSDGIFDYDKISFTSTEPGLVWPVQSAERKAADYAFGIWIGALYGSQQELRTAVSMYSSVFSPGNIPVLGGVPPSSVCLDPQWRPYLVELNNQNLVNGGVETKTAGGHEYIITYDPWSSWPVSQGAPYVEVNGTPGYQPGWNADRPGIGNSSARPDEICYMVYMDYSNCTDQIHTAEVSLPGGTLPLGVQIEQIVYAYNTYPLQDMYFVKLKIINRSASYWDSTYICIVDDCDLGDASNDAAGCDSSRSTGYIYNGTNSDTVYGIIPPAMGIRLLQGPMIYTGNPLDTAKLPYGNYSGYKLLGLGGYNVFQNVTDPCIGDPDNAIAGYNYMMGLDGCGIPLMNPVTNLPTKFAFSGDACHTSGWFDPLATDRRHILSTGALRMNQGDTQTFVFSVMVAQGSSNYNSVCALLESSDLAKRFYDSNFTVVPNAIQSLGNTVPKQYTLYQNYPNPFNPATKIKFSIPVVGNGRDRSVHLTIYDALGREVRVLVNESLAPGTYEVDFNASDLPSGVYFYRISAGEFMQTMKMILLK